MPGIKFYKLKLFINIFDSIESIENLLGKCEILTMCDWLLVIIGISVVWGKRGTLKENI